jgi:hypothetical protein
MSRIGKLTCLALALAAAPAVAATTPVAGTWVKVPSAPTPVFGAGVWNGKQLLVVGRKPFKPIAVAESYDPSDKTWRRLTAPPKLDTDFMCCKVVWTGKRLLAFGAFSAAAFDPATNSWHSLRGKLPGGIIVWTGREAIGWGGGCCGDANASGAAYNPSTGVFRKLARSPLAPDQHPFGAWTGRELVLSVSGTDPEGKPYPARYARTAAYDPVKNSWRRLAPAPAHGGAATWDGRELLVVGASANGRMALALNPLTNRWRVLAPTPAAANGGSVFWTGSRLLLWAGHRGYGYDPRTNRWSPLPRSPLRSRDGSIVVWTGKALIVWGGEIGTPVGTSTPPRFPLDGAAFTPRTP